jgi:hypothetical protein
MPEDFNVIEETPRVRSIPYGKNKIRIERTDPYGFWSISFERGAPPEHLRGQYTSFRDAEKDVSVYLASKDAQPQAA